VLPPFDPAVVVEKFVGVMASYGIRECRSDRYAGAWPESAFRKYSVRLEMSKLTAPELYLEFGALLNMGIVELIKDDRLLGQLVALERRTHSGGKDTVDHPPGAHDDLANAVAGAAVLAFQQRVWTEEEMEAHLPTAIPNQTAEIILAGGADEFVEKKRRQSAEQEMDEFMKESGCSRIVK